MKASELISVVADIITNRGDIEISPDSINLESLGVMDFGDSVNDKEQSARSARSEGFNYGRTVGYVTDGVTHNPYIGKPVENDWLKGFEEGAALFLP